MTYTRFGSTGCVPVTVMTGICVRACKIEASLDSWYGAECSTTKAIPELAGSAAKKSCKARPPPALLRERDFVLVGQGGGELFQPLDAVQLAANRLLVRVNGGAAVIAKECAEKVYHQRTSVRGRGRGPRPSCVNHDDCLMCAPIISNRHLTRSNAVHMKMQLKVQPLRVQPLSCACEKAQPKG